MDNLLEHQMRNKYFSTTNDTMAEKLDRAWLAYLNLNKSISEEERREALEFMIYVFDIRKFSNDRDALKPILTQLMLERDIKKENNPEYIPMLTSGRYNFEHNARVLTAKSSETNEVEKNITSGHLLKVNEEDKKADIEEQSTFLDSRERTEFDIEIFNGLMHKKGAIFDSSKLIAHDKPGYVAFTLNSNGNLSVFKHLSGERDTQSRKLVHSSMNAGAPVLCAGEMKVVKGKLISINTYSGHYEPSIYSVALFLEYLNDRGIDISQTKVYLQSKPGVGSGLKSTKTKLEGDDEPWYEVPATDIVLSVKSIMKSNLNSINDYLNSSKTKCLINIGNRLAKTKYAIAKDFCEELSCALDMVKDSSSLRDMQASLDWLDSIITRYSEKILENSKGKLGRLDTKFANMKAQIQEAKSKLGNVDTVEAARLDAFKKGF